MEITNEKLEKDLKRWFFSFALGQIILTIAAAIWFAAQINTQIKEHEQKIINLQKEMDKKASIEMLMEIKRDVEKRTDEIMMELRYIRTRIDNNIIYTKK